MPRRLSRAESDSEKSHIIIKAELPSLQPLSLKNFSYYSNSMEKVRTRARGAGLKKRIDDQTQGLEKNVF